MASAEGLEPSFSAPFTISSLEDYLGYAEINKAEITPLTVPLLAL